MEKEEITNSPEESIQSEEVTQNSEHKEEIIGVGETSQDAPEKPKTASSGLFLKLAIALALAGGLGLGGFWCYTKIILGMNASETIARLDLKIAGMEAGQAEIAKALQGIESRLDQLGKSDRIISEIPAKLNGLEKGLADIRQTIFRVSQAVAQMEKGEPLASSSIPAVQEGQAPANLKMENYQEPDITSLKTPSPQETPLIQTKEQVFENFLKSLLKNIGRGLKWSAEKLFFVVDEILKRVI